VLQGANAGTGGAGNPFSGGAGGNGTRIYQFGGSGGTGGTGVTAGGAGGAGGTFILQGGTGGDGGTGGTGAGGAGGTGGSFLLTAGSGGSGSTGNTDGDGGAGGSFTFALGSGGSGGGVGGATGSDGSFVIKGGSNANASAMFALQSNGGTNFVTVSPTGGLIVNSASSTILNLVTINATSTSATTTNLAVTGFATTSSLRVSNGFFQDGFSSGCTGSDTETVLYNASTGKFTCGTDSGGSGQQTPWLSDIDAAGYDLQNLNTITATSTLLLQATSVGVATSAPALASALGLHGNLFISGNITNVSSITATGTVHIMDAINDVPLPGMLNVYATSSTAIPVVVRAATSQTADLFQARRANGVTVAKIDPSGHFYVQNHFATGTLQVTGTTTLYNDLVFNNSVEARPLSIIVPGTTGIQFATTAATGLSDAQYPILTIKATTTGMMDYARVAVGTSTTWREGGLRDQFTVAGRMYSTWQYASCDFLGMSFTATINALTAHVCGQFGFYEHQDGQITVGTSSPTYAVLRANAAGDPGKAAIIGTPPTYISATSSPVLEAWVRLNNTTNAAAYVGFIYSTSTTWGPGQGGGVSLAGGSSEGFYFLANGSVNNGNWTAVNKFQGAATTTFDTGISANLGGKVLGGVSQYQRLRVEASTGTVTYLINGNVVARLSTTTSTMSLMAGVIMTNNGAVTPVLKEMDIRLLRLWNDDPSGVSGWTSPAPGGPDGGVVEPPPPTPPVDLERTAIVGQFANGEPPPNDIPGGSIVSFAPNSYSSSTALAVRMASTTHESLIAGVSLTSSTQAGVMLGLGSTEIAIQGRALLRVSAAHGAIKAGDWLTSSDMAGVAVRATTSGMMVGRALEDFNGPTDGTPILVDVDPGFETITTSHDAPTDFTGYVAQALSDTTKVVFGGVGKLIKSAFDVLVANVANIGHIFTRDITLLPDGEIRVPEGANQISGSGVVPQGATSIVIQNTKVTAGSKIFVTPTTIINSALSVTEKVPGQSFTVSLSSPAASDVSFDWLIFTSYPANGSSSGGSSSSGNGAPQGGTSAPTAPTNLAGTAISSNEVHLSWTDTSIDELGFKVEQSTNGVSFGEVGSVNPDTTTFARTGLFENVTYYFRVVAYNDIGSSVSEVIQVTTPFYTGGGASVENTAILCSDTIDNDSDSLIDDADGDCVTFIPPPTALENTAPLCSDGIDNDVDGFIDDADTDCSPFAAVPQNPENTALLCADTIDNDGDDLIDLADGDCSAFVSQSQPPATEDTALLCADAIDNDGDDLIDLADSDCASFISPLSP
jgi:hypothetical protein